MPIDTSTFFDLASFHFETLVTLKRILKESILIKLVLNMFPGLDLC